MDQGESEIGGRHMGNNIIVIKNPVVDLRKIPIDDYAMASFIVSYTMDGNCLKSIDFIKSRYPINNFLRTDWLTIFELIRNDLRKNGIEVDK